MRNQWIKHDRLTSTSTHIADLLKQQDLEEGTVVLTDYQEAGRGQGSHSWVSNRGDNLLMSMLLYPAFLSASRQFHLSRVVSLAICDVLGTLGIESLIKWPNDILSNKGKIAGILIEHSIAAGNLTHSIIGIGLNLNQDKFPGFPVPASSVRLESGKLSDLGEVGELVESRLLSRYQDLKAGMTGKLEQEYLDKLFKAGEPALFKTDKGTFEGIIKGVNDFGELLVLHKGEIRAYGHGTIQMELESGRP